MGANTPGAPVARRQLLQGLAVGAWMAVGARAAAAAPAALSLTLAGTTFLHRWSRQDQHEFTPAGDEDLTRWADMLTLAVHPGVRSGEALAELANAVLARYRTNGKVLVTRSVPRSASGAAQHLAVAVLGRPQFLEAAFARFLLHDGVGLVVVRSHRVHGTAAGPAMSRWLAEHGAATEEALMAWRSLPPVASLGALPQAGPA